MPQLTFEEFEAFAEAVKEASMTMRITAMEERKWTLQYAAIGALRLQKGYEGGGNIAEGETFRDGWTFYCQSSPVFANGQVVTSDEVFVAPPTSEFCLACQPSHEWLTVFVPTSLLFPHPDLLDFVLPKRPQVLKPPPHLTRRFTLLLRRFLSVEQQRPQLMNWPAALNSFETELLRATKDLFTSKQLSYSRSFTRWYCQTKTALTLAMSQLDQSISISELARHSGVPERTLRTAFQRCYGLSPIEYLRINRLHQTRRLLMEGFSNTATVTQIAFSMGFWDLGRFAASYRQLFGEFPSETLRRTLAEKTCARFNTSATQKQADPIDPRPFT